MIGMGMRVIDLCVITQKEEIGMSKDHSYEKIQMQAAKVKILYEVFQETMVDTVKKHDKEIKEFIKGLEEHKIAAVRSRLKKKV